MRASNAVVEEALEFRGRADVARFLHRYKRVEHHSIYQKGCHSTAIVTFESNVSVSRPASQAQVLSSTSRSNIYLYRPLYGPIWKSPFSSKDIFFFFAAVT
jgi:hypothetical protein